MTSSTQASSGASLLPALDVSRVTCRSCTLSRNARNAGVVIITGPRLSSLTASTRRAAGQRVSGMTDSDAPARVDGRGSALFTDDEPRCATDIRCDPVGHARRGHLPFGFVAVVDQHAAATGAMRRFDIVQDVAD